MRRLLTILFVTIAACTLSSCERDLYSLFGLDGKAQISVKLYGSHYDFDGDKLTSDGGVFTSNNHPEIVLYDGRGFRFDLYRAIGAGDAEATLYFDLENTNEAFELNRSYSLATADDSYACIEFREPGETEELPSGGTVTHINTYRYNAEDGHITFTKQEPYGKDYLFSGEFEFVGRTKDGDEIEVRSGKFSNCRICFKFGEGCNGW